LDARVSLRQQVIDMTKLARAYSDPAIKLDAGIADIIAGQIDVLGATAVAANNNHETVIRFVINEIDIVVSAVSAMLDFHEALCRLMPHRQPFDDIQKIRGFSTVISVVAANAALAGRVIEPDFVEQYGIVAAAEAAAAKCA